MKPLPQKGVFFDGGRYWTVNRVPGRKVYRESLRLRGGKEYRAWDPRRSKMAALLRKDPKTPWPNPAEDMLYLGASSGTTVSHLSDFMQGLIIAVEFSPRSVRDLSWNLAPRDNAIPVFDDARYPQRYAPYLHTPAGSIVQDVAQRDQVGIFLENLKLVKPGGLGFLFVKARSIHVADPVKTIVDRVEQQLRQAGLEILRRTDLAPFEKDHTAFVVRT